MQMLSAPAAAAAAASSPSKRKRTRLDHSTTTIDLPKFDQWLDGESDEQFGGWDTLEKSKRILDGNYQLRREHVKLDQKSSSLACRTMVRAQYGRTRSPFVQQVLDLTETGAEDRFLDLGSGIGSVVLHAAAVAGCEAFGVEICVGRHEVALELHQSFAKFLPQATSRVQFLHGDFRTPDILALARSCTVLFVNNANGVFNVRSSPSDCFSLDWHVARLVGGMQDGARIMCYDALSDLDSAPLNQCFDKTEHVSAAGGTSWTKKSKSLTNFCIYRKTRSEWTCDRCSSVNALVVNISQEEEENRPATTTISSEWNEMLNDTCKQCTEQGFRKPYALRKRTTPRFPFAQAG